MANEPPSETQLMLAVEAGAGAVERVAAVLAAVPVASLIVTAPPGRELAAADVLEIVAAGQKSGVAVLIEGDARLARTVKADGVHLGVGDDIVARFEEAREIVGGRAVVGADAGRSRHDAMSLGEKGADYVAFGVPAFVKERETAFERQLDLVDWWSEIFEIASVAKDAADAGQAAALAAAGADFLCLTLPAGMAVADAVALAVSWRQALADSGAGGGGAA